MTLRPAMLFIALALAWPAAAQVRTPDDYLRQIDRDGNRRVSEAEFIAWMSRGFEAMDRDRDGLLSRDELPGGRGRPVSRAEHRAALAAAFKRQDADRDGYLSAKELAAPPR